jgi:putative flippase GtrA
MIARFLLLSPQFVRFALIGCVNTCVHAVVLVLLIEKLSAGVVLANLIAFLLSNGFSYLMNSRLTFHTKLSCEKYLKFLAASLLALGFTLLITWMMDRLGFHYLQSFIVIVIIIPVVSYLGVKIWVFSGFTE